MKIPTNLSLLLEYFFKSLTEQNIDFAVLRNFEKLPIETSRDLDLYINQIHDKNVSNILHKCASKYKFLIIKETSKYKYRKIILTDLSCSFSYFFQIDFFMNENLYGCDFFNPKEWDIKKYNSNMKIPTKKCYLSSLLLTGVFHGEIKQRYIEIINHELKNKDLLLDIRNFLGTKIGVNNAISLLEEVRSGNNKLHDLSLSSKANFILNNFSNNPFLTFKNIKSFLWEHFISAINPSGKFIVFVGPDGSGKTSTINDIKKRAIPELFTDYFYFHNHVPMLPELKHIKNLFTLKYKNSPQNQNVKKSESFKSIQNVKLKYIYITYYAINHLLFTPYLISLKWRNKIIIGDRYFYDYYFQNGFNWKSTKYLEFLTKLVPKPDVTILLKNDADIIFSRKPEITLSEINRQINLISKHKYKFTNTFEIKTNIAINETSKKILKKILS